jgi:hypothetical protein
MTRQVLELTVAQAQSQVLDTLVLEVDPRNINYFIY